MRYFNVFGPRQDPSSEYSGVISRSIYVDGEQTRDFVHVKDVVQANILASLSRSGVFNIAEEEDQPELARFHDMRDPGVNVQPEHGDPRAGDIRDSLADISKAREIGYELCRPGNRCEQLKAAAIPRSAGRG